MRCIRGELRHGDRIRTAEGPDDSVVEVDVTVSLVERYPGLATDLLDPPHVATLHGQGVLPDRVTPGWRLRGGDPSAAEESDALGG